MTSFGEAPVQVGRKLTCLSGNFLICSGPYRNQWCHGRADWKSAGRFASKPIHRRAEAWRDLWNSSGPITLLKQGHLAPVTQNHVQRAFEDLQGQRFHSLSGKPCQCSVTLTGRKCFLMFRGSFLCFNLCPSSLILSLSTTKNNLALSSLHPPLRYLYA